MTVLMGMAVSHGQDPLPELGGWGLLADSMLGGGAGSAGVQDVECRITNKFRWNVYVAAQKITLDNLFFTFCLDVPGGPSTKRALHLNTAASTGVQGYLTSKKTHPPRTLP